MTHNEIIAFFVGKVESVEEVIMVQYKNALQNKEDGEANGYAHSLAIVKDLHREIILCTPPLTDANQIYQPNASPQRQ